MRELRTHENEKFERFFQLIRDAAASKNAIFFVDCGEGRELFTDSMEGEDLSGWLIPQSEADRFQPEFDKGEVSDRWDSFMRMAVWSQSSGRVSIQFDSF
jgi:hypothetical protein